MLTSHTHKYILFGIALIATLLITNSVNSLPPNPTLVKDINAVTESSRPRNFVDANGITFFTADSGSDQTELWKSDGSEVGTTLVKGFNASHTIEYMTNVNETLFFVAGKRELWKSDGTPANTVQINIASTVGNIFFIRNLISINSTLYFSLHDSNGEELWKSDGTEAGTKLVKDINTTYSSSSSNPTYLTNANGTLFFVADDGIHSNELWKSDGTEIGTELVKDIIPGNASGPETNPYNLTAVGDSLFFTAEDGINGEELWYSDGTEAGTYLVKVISDGYPRFKELTAVNGGLIFVHAITNSSAETLWYSDGTEAGTIEIEDPSSYNSLTNVAGQVFFVKGDSFPTLWKSDGTINGATQIAFNFNGAYTQIRIIGYTNNILYFTAKLTQTGAGYLFRADSEGNNIENIQAGPAYSDYGSIENTLLYAASTQLSGIELWQSDGTTDGTFLTKDINTRTPDAQIKLPVVVNDTAFFSAVDSIHGEELWRTDGTEAGTSMVKDVYPGSMNISELIQFGQGLFFGVPEGSGVYAVWTSDGTEAGTTQVKEWDNTHGFESDNFGYMNGSAFFQLDPFHGDNELWSSNGTEAGTKLLDTNTRSIRFLTDANNSQFFVYGTFSGSQLWRTNNSIEGTFQLMGLSDNVSSFTTLNRYLYFTNRIDGLWKSDGSIAGTLQINDMENIHDLVTLNGALYFLHDNELWQSDGTEVGTTLVKDIGLANFSSNPHYLVVLNNTLFFTTSEGELWRSDGTADGTTLVKLIANIEYGLFGLTSYKDQLFFVNNKYQNPDKIWMSNGTEAGTIPVTDINSGGQGPYVTYTLLGLNNSLLYIFDDLQHGYEWWRIDVTPNDRINVSNANFDVVEGASSIYTLTLASQPTHDVTIDLTANGQLSVTPASLTFTDQNWGQPQSVTATAVDDTKIEWLHSSTISHTATSNDPAYNGIIVENVILTITDNDDPLTSFLPFITISNDNIHSMTTPKRGGLN